MAAVIAVTITPKKHSKLALSDDELEFLMAGAIPTNTPKDEIQALLYAQYWAEANSHPDPEIQQKLVDTYGI